MLPTGRTTSPTITLGPSVSDRGAGATHASPYGLHPHSVAWISMTSETVCASVKERRRGKSDRLARVLGLGEPGRHCARRGHRLGIFLGPRRRAARGRSARAGWGWVSGSRRRARRCLGALTFGELGAMMPEAGGHLRVHSRRVRALPRVSVWVGAVHCDREWISCYARGSRQGVSGCVGAADARLDAKVVPILVIAVFAADQCLGNSEERWTAGPGRPQPKWARSS